MATYNSVYEYLLAKIAAAAGGGGGSTNDWSGTAAQDPVHAQTDYFDDSSLDGKWTEADPGGNITVAEGDQRLKITATSIAGVEIGMLVQTAPAVAQYCVTAKVHWTTSSGTVSFICLLVGEDLITNPSTDGFVFIEQSRTTSPDLDMKFVGYTNYAAVHNVYQDYTGWPKTSMNASYLRIFVDNTANTYTALVSDNGLAWTKMGPALAQASSSVPADPDTVGLGIAAQSTTDDAVLYCSMFRVDETSDPYLPCGEYV